MKKNVVNLWVKRSNFMLLVSLSIMLALLAPVIINAQAGKVNFSGTWALNAEKSTISQGQGGGQRPGGGNFVAKQEANLLTVERTRTNQNGETSTQVSKYTLDGKECVNTSQRGDSKSVATWAADGKTLTIATKRTIERDGETREMKTTEIWSLTDAKILSVQSTSTSPNGERKNSFVYDKK